MKAIISQREQLDTHGTPIDVLESTYIVFFEMLGIELFQLSNFTKNLDKVLKEQCFDLIILTGGGSIPSNFYKEKHYDFLQSNRDYLEWTLMEFSIKNSTPVLGICRGMEYMNAFLGGKVSKLILLDKVRKIGVEHDIILKNGVKISVNNYHKDGFFEKDIAKEFQILALDIENNIVEAIYSPKFKWLGIQWHPERLMKNEISKKISENLIREFIKRGGIIDESYNFSSRTGDET